MPYVTLIAANTFSSFEDHLSKQTWTLRDHNLSVGDLILFVKGIHYSGEGHPPAGFPILASYDTVDITIDEIYRAELRGIEDNQLELSYKDPEKDIKMIQLKKEVREAIRQCVTGKDLTEINLAHFFDYYK